MKDERFEQLMGDAARTYNKPQATPPFDDMWESIESARHGAVQVIAPPPRRPLYKNSWLRMAAVLLVGIGVGRISAMRATVPAGESVALIRETSNPAMDVPEQYRTVTDDYLGQAAALLISLPSELDARRVDAEFVTRADDLLMQTRLLLDSPAATDPSLRTLFEDLEVVLIQVVRLQADRNQTKVDMLHEALEQRDVLPRLRNAVVDHIAD